MGRSEDSDFYDLENEDIVKQYAAKLMAKRSMLFESVSEEELIEMSTCKTMIIHFFKDTFKKCTLMNTVLEQLAKKYPWITFVYIRVENAPKMCTSLKISTLPFVGFFKDGYFVDELVGFEKLGNRESITVKELEDYLNQTGFLDKPKV